MIAQVSKNEMRQRVHQRIREKLRGTAERPRLNVYRSLHHIYAQLIDDSEGKTLVSANSREGAKGAASRTGGNVAAAKAVGKALAERARSEERRVGKECRL